MCSRVIEHNLSLMDWFTVPHFDFAPTRQSIMSASNTITTPNTNATQRDERNVRPCVVNGYGLLPYDSDARIPATMVEVDIQHMMGPRPECMKAIMYLQLLHTVSGSNNDQKNSTTSYQSYYNKKKSNASGSSSYFRLLLFHDVSSDDGEVVYIVEKNNLNQSIWSRNALLRDFGVVSIGTYIAVINPMPITTMFCNEIPILGVRGACFVMKDPAVTRGIRLDSTITQNVTRAFIVNNVHLDIHHTSVQTTKCSGHFCDKQRAVEIESGTRSCGCYQMANRMSNLAFVHWITVGKSGNDILSMVDFSSAKFSMLYLKEGLSSSVKRVKFDATDEFWDLQDCIINVLKYINEHGGFTVTGWYKKGQINDVSNEENQNHVESGEIAYHVVSIIISNKDLIVEKDLNDKKFSL